MTPGCRRAFLEEKPPGHFPVFVILLHRLWRAFEMLDYHLREHLTYICIHLRSVNFIAANARLIFLCTFFSDGDADAAELFAHYWSSSKSSKSPETHIIRKSVVVRLCIIH